MKARAAADLVTSARSALEPMLDMPGRILYSSIETVRPGDLYLMGLNPAEGYDRYASIGESLTDMPRHYRNTYIDDDWGAGVGKSLLQTRVRWMLQELDFSVRDTFATNLVFARSGSWSKEPQLHVSRCWLVHTLFLSIIQPRVILVFGKPAYDALLERSKHAKHVDAVDAEFLNYRFYASEAVLLGKSTRIVCVPHLSRYPINLRPAKVAWLRSVIE